jgi:hypothetical protein
MNEMIQTYRVNPYVMVALLRTLALLSVTPFEKGENAESFE